MIFPLTKMLDFEKCCFSIKKNILCRGQRARGRNVISEMGFVLNEFLLWPRELPKKSFVDYLA